VPDEQPDGLDDLYDIARLADRLGVEHATIRVWLSRKVPWLPPPDGRLNGGAVWRAETLAGLEDRRRPGRPGPKPRGGSPAMPPAGTLSAPQAGSPFALPGDAPHLPPDGPAVTG
jgi:hypothetical protein